MRRLALGLACAITSIAFVAPGCGSASVGGAGGSSIQLEGLFITTAPGPIKELEFIDDTHVNVTWADCDDDNPCTSADTYVLQDGATKIQLTEPSGKTNELDISALDQDADLTDESLHVLDGPSNLLGSSGSLTNPSQGSPVVSGFSTQLNNSGCTQLFKKSNLLPNDQTAFDFFRSKGLSAEQAAGIVGNLDQESNNNPGSAQPNGPGRGIAQWSVGARWDKSPNDNATAFAAQQHELLDSLQLQLEFIWYELSTFPRYGLSDLKGQSSVTGAAQAFATKFEACGKCLQTKRDQYAQAAYNAFAKDPVGGGGCGGSSDASAPSGSPGSTSSSGSPGSTSPSSSSGSTSTSGSPGSSSSSGSPASTGLGGGLPIPTGGGAGSTSSPSGALPNSSFFGLCTHGGLVGVCIDVATCAAKRAKSTAGLCGGPDSIECCTLD
jgi:hypothetical protein